MVQVIYEEGSEEYWQKPLREAILNIGNSWAGSIIRRQNSAASYAKNAADRAHEAYIAQIGINSRERIAGASLAATKERNETLNKQYTSSHELQQRKVQNDEDHTAYLRGQDLDSYNAISAVQELKDAQGFKVDASGSIVPKGLDKANYLRVRNTIKKSPTVWAASQNNVDAYDGEMRKVRRRLSMLRALSKKDVNVYNKLLTGMPPQEGQDPITTDKLVGSGGQGMLDDIAARVGDDIGWKALLKNYEIDDVTSSSLKSHEHDALTDHGIMLGDTSFSIGNHPYKPNDGDQLGRTKSYHNVKKHLGNAFSATDKDNTAMLAAINNLDEGFQGVAKNTTDLVSSAAINFMQKNGVYFTNAKALTSQMRTNITKVAQAGPDPVIPLTDPTNLAIHSLMFDKGTPAEKRAKANEIMRTFVKAQGWHKTNKIRSVVKNRPASAPEIAKLFDSPPDSLVDAETLEETGTITLGDAGSQDSSVINPQANASDGPSPSNIHSFASAGFDSEKLIKYLTKSGKLYDEATDRTVSNGMVTGSKINLLTIPVDELNNIIYSGRTDTPETTFFTKKLKDMAAVAEKAPKKIPTPFDYPTASKEEYSKITNAWATKENLLALYKTNQEIGEQVMLLDPSKLFGQNGQPLGWQDSINKEPPGARIDWKTIKATFSGHPHIFSQFEAIFEGLGLSKTDLDDGSEFGIGQRIRNLAKSETFNLNNRQFIPVSK